MNLASESVKNFGRGKLVAGEHESPERLEENPLQPITIAWRDHGILG
jgi:hypothetical protein